MSENTKQHEAVIVALQQQVFDLRECVLTLCEEKRQWRARALELERRVKILDDPETCILHHSVLRNVTKRAERAENELKSLIERGYVTA